MTVITVSGKAAELALRYGMTGQLTAGRPRHWLAPAGLELSIVQCADTTFAGVPKYVHHHDPGISFNAWAPDWPDGCEFFNLIAANGTVSQTGGDAYIQALKSPVVKMASTGNPGAPTCYTSQIDMAVMKETGILPEVHAKSQLYRGPQLTKVHLQPYHGVYNYAVSGVKWGSG